MNEPPPINPQFPPQQPPPGYGPPGFAPPAKNNNVLVIVIVCVVVFGFCAVAVLAAVLFPVFAQGKAAARKSLRLSDMKQVGLGCIMYTFDNKNQLPNLADFGVVEAELRPYIKSSDLLFDPVTKERIVFNKKLANVDLEKLDNPNQKVLAYNPTLEAGNLREVVFADGHAKVIPDFELQSDLSGSSGF